MIAFSKISPFLPMFLMLIIGIFIVERVRFVNRRCDAIETQYNALNATVGALNSKPVQCSEEVEDLPLPVVSTFNKVECVIPEPEDPIVDVCIVDEKLTIKKRSPPTSENELVDLLKSVDAIQDITKPVVLKKTEEEKQLKQLLRSKGLSCKGTVEELRARAKTAA